MKRTTLLIASAAVIALTLQAPLEESKVPLPLGSFIIATDDSQAEGNAANNQESAKMGEDEGTHVGDEQGSAPENDTKKVDQPAHKNPTTSNVPDKDGETQPQ